jgi:hypothetical protein
LQTNNPQLSPYFNNKNQYIKNIIKYISSSLFFIR